jgi:hypothetical protein
MDTIILSPEYAEMVLEGKKVTTIRRGQRTYNTGKGALQVGNQNINIMIKAVRFKLFKFLTEDDARHDGFTSLSDLKNALFNFYPDLHANETMTIVEFSLPGRKNDRDKRKVNIQEHSTFSFRN